jgi:hypothetical protein
MKRKMMIITISLLFSLSIIWGDAAEAVTSLVGRNAEGYLGPIGTILGTDMNSGFYRKASPHKILGFDFTFDLAYAMAPPGQTTYKFKVPHSEIAYSFPFKFPKELLAPDDPILAAALPTATDENGVESEDESLYQDQEISLGVYADQLILPPDGMSQNIFGIDSSTILTIDPSEAVKQIKEQVIYNTWLIAKDIAGIGTDLNFTYTLLEGTPAEFDSTITIKALYGSEEEFGASFSGEIDTLIKEGLGDLNLQVPIPGGLDLGKSFESLPIDFGIPLPIVQASFGLPFHTEVTVRGIPQKVPIPGIGSLKFGGFGGKIGISEFFKEKPKKHPKIQISPKIKYVLEELPSNITPANIDSALAEIRNTNMDLSELDMLNSQFHSGDSMAVYDILTQLEKISTIPKNKKSKPKGWPIDVSLGYYTNDLILDMGDAKINSTNNLLSLQAGKTLNIPFISFLGGVGLYGGIGLESSDLNLKYTLANPIAYGCFTGSGDATTYTKTNSENVEYTEKSCEEDTKSWKSGVPTDISLSFPGENKFRTTIGARIRVLFVDVYVDYNTGTSNAINAGVGITFR